MEKISEFFSDYKEYILFGISIVLFLLLSFLLFYYFKSNINILDKKIKDRPIVEVKDEKKDKELFAVDVKGEVKKPGVYFLEKGKRVIDAVNKAGGFTKNANSFVNNLSMNIIDEMVIIIYSKSEIDDYLSTKGKENQVIDKCEKEIVVNNSCISKSDNNKTSNDSSSKDNSFEQKSDDKTDEESVNKKISINSGTKEELMTLPGIGESKALAIIEYRKNKQFETIEEIKEVSGIGDSLFEKIKDFITT